ncbi:carbohydrate ABC transporter permease [Microbacterium sp. TNHR37B]|uniref:carbohydrate ABC transporter permease n=1 Tax=Microbacterium sp. TNHR37B TaxID=1775956 RepID=UPI0007B1D76E|nr:carbohydrate ABC transporter permease [Microbacterium sp. TNHR37B]KZE88583.1 L-arabinose transport system permease protein AraQ [Microbacterium sp. TNHR37B]
MTAPLSPLAGASPASPTLETITAVLPRGARPPRRRFGKRRTWQTVLWVAVMVVLTAIILYPLAWMLSASFKPTAEFGANQDFLPHSPTIGNYVKVLEGVGGVPLWQFFLNSFVLAAGSVIGTVISASLAAYAFARVRFAGSGVWFAVMIGTLLLPFHVLIIPQYMLYRNLELVDTFVPLLLGKFLATEAFFVFLIVQFIRALPRDMDEAARIDGCGHGRIYWSIILPLVKPALVTASIFAFIWSWNDFLGPLLYLNSTELYPLPLALRVFNDQTSTSDYGATVAVSVLALLPILLFFIVFQRFLVEGVSTQGLKG